MTNHSTGPRTTEGKQRSSLNAFRHGLTGQTVVISPEDRIAHAEFCQSFFDDFQPQTALERQLVQTVADCSWRLNRLRAMEQSLLSLGALEFQEQVPTDDSLAATACAAALTFEKNLKTLGNLSLYEQRISRACERALTQLKTEQAERKAQQERDLARAAALKAQHDQQQAKAPQPLAYDPGQDGFVFSNEAIELWTRAQNLFQRAARTTQPRLKAAAA